MNSQSYIGISVAIVGLVSVYFLADTNWIYLSSLLSAVGGAVFGASLRSGNS